MVRVKNQRQQIFTNDRANGRILLETRTMLGISTRTDLNVTSE